MSKPGTQDVFGIYRALTNNEGCLLSGLIPETFYHTFSLSWNIESNVDYKINIKNECTKPVGNLEILLVLIKKLVDENLLICDDISKFLVSYGQDCTAGFKPEFFEMKQILLSKDKNESRQHQDPSHVTPQETESKQKPTTTTKKQKKNTSSPQSPKNTPSPSVTNPQKPVHKSNLSSDGLEESDDNSTGNINTDDTQNQEEQPIPMHAWKLKDLSARKREKLEVFDLNTPLFSVTPPNLVAACIISLYPIHISDRIKKIIGIYDNLIRYLDSDITVGHILSKPISCTTSNYLFYLSGKLLNIATVSELTQTDLIGSLVERLKNCNANVLKINDSIGIFNNTINDLHPANQYNLSNIMAKLEQIEAGVNNIVLASQPAVVKFDQIEDIPTFPKIDKNIREKWGLFDSDDDEDSVSTSVKTPSTQITHQLANSISASLRTLSSEKVLIADNKKKPPTGSDFLKANPGLSD